MASLGAQGFEVVPYTGGITMIQWRYRNHGLNFDGILNVCSNGNVAYQSFGP